jgi:integrase
MNVTVREKKLQKGMIGLYLDIYHNGKRTKESLKLKLYAKPKTQSERNHNKEIKEIAKKIAAERQLEEIKSSSGMMEEFAVNTNFLEYFEKVTNKRRDSKTNYDNWLCTLKILRNYCSDDTTFADIDRNWVESFRHYLHKEYRTKAGKLLSQNSKHSYFNKFRACFKEALRDKIIIYNPCEGVDGFKMDEPRREFLTIEEVRKLVETECESEVLKRAFLFCCLTGLRWSDAMKLQWKDLQHSSDLGYFVRFQQKKTRGQETLPINEEALGLMGDKENAEDRIFRGLRYSTGMNFTLKRWILRAGISKNITFHCARHTFATLQLTAGTDIYTVSKLLGHREVRTTAIYAKVIDDKKKEAVNKLPKIF